MVVIVFAICLVEIIKKQKETGTIVKSVEEEDRIPRFKFSITRKKVHGICERIERGVE